jgi:hypothetical protein
MCLRGRSEVEQGLKICGKLRFSLCQMENSFFFCMKRRGGRETRSCLQRVEGEVEVEEIFDRALQEQVRL